MKQTATRDRFQWRLLLYGILAMLLIGIIDALLESDGMVYLFVVLPIISVTLIVLLVIAAIRKRPPQFVLALTMLAIYGLFSFAFFRDHFAIRNAVRWSLWARQYKTEVLKQPNLQGELKHIEWDGWGFAGVGDTTVYLAFDPTDSLDMATKNHRAGKFAGVPCPVPAVDRLEKQWYAIMFYTEELWDKDCGMKD